MIVSTNIAHLDQLKSLISSLSDEDYTVADNVLSGSSVGQHFRHILEFYLTMLNGVKKGEISYDSRNRDLRIENERLIALLTVDSIIVQITQIEYSKMIQLKSNYSESTEVNSLYIATSVERELAYALDHMIHHLAIVKIALAQRGITIPENIGVAPSTIRHKNRKCVQSA